MIDGWDPGDWQIKISLDANDGYVHSEAIFPVHVNALLVKPPNPLDNSILSGGREAAG